MMLRKEAATMSEAERYQQIKSKVDSYNARVIELEVKQKNAQEELDKCNEDLKVMGYNNVDEARLAYSKLEEEVKTELDSLEAKLNEI